jgi:hypothetical protein
MRTWRSTGSSNPIDMPQTSISPPGGDTTSATVIKLDEGGRHTASSLGDDAGVDREIKQRTLGHANFEMTGHYTHPEAARFRQAAEDVARYVEEAGS